jgi:hypothetical protein
VEITRHLATKQNINELFNYFFSKSLQLGSSEHLPPNKSRHKGFTATFHFENMPKLANEWFWILILLLLVAEMYRVRICGAVSLSLWHPSPQFVPSSPKGPRAQAVLVSSSSNLLKN